MGIVGVVRMSYYCSISQGARLAALEAQARTVGSAKGRTPQAVPGATEWCRQGAVPVGDMLIWYNRRRRMVVARLMPQKSEPTAGDEE